MKSNLEKALALFNPNEKGESDWVAIEAFSSVDLRWTANGNLRRGAPWSLSTFKWDVKRGPGRKISALRMTGLNDDDSFNQVITLAIRRELESELVCNLSLLPIPRLDREIDHRFGNKNHPDYVELYKPENQSVTYFQLTHRVLNLQKRQMCVVCIDTQTRPPHPTLGFAQGDKEITRRFPCQGCFLAEPERFRGRGS